jgi:hypothetical protein
MPLGVPASLAEALGPAAGANFLELLRHAGSIPGFFDTCPEPARWSPQQPFFSAAGEAELRRWARQMEAFGVSAYRAIDLAGAARSPLVVPAAPGAAARDVWRTLLADVDEIGGRVWPFDGSMAALTSAPGVVLGEIDPRAASPLATAHEKRRAAAIGVLQQEDWVREHGIVLGGLDAARRSKDAFDALFSVADLLRSVFEGAPLDGAHTHPMEGGLLGTSSPNLGVRESAYVEQSQPAA